MKPTGNTGRIETFESVPKRFFGQPDLNASLVGIRHNVKKTCDFSYYQRLCFTPRTIVDDLLVVDNCDNVGAAMPTTYCQFVSIN